MVMRLDITKAIKTRRSIRAFTQTPIPSEVFKSIEEAILYSPSGSNAQESHFVIVQDKGQIKKLKRFAQGVADYPAAIVVICSNKEEALKRGGLDTLEALRFVNIGIVASYIMLVTHSYGVGSCPARSFHQKSVKYILQLPDEIEPELLISLGYPNQTPRPKNMKQTNEVISYDKFGQGR